MRHVKNKTHVNKRERKPLVINFTYLFLSKVILQVSVKKANQKLHALARIVHYIDFRKRKILMKAFTTSQFSYCPLICMLHTRTY